MFSWLKAEEGDEENIMGSAMDIVSPMEFFENEPAKKRKAPILNLEESEDAENTDMIDKLAEKMSEEVDGKKLTKSGPEKEKVIVKTEKVEKVSSRRREKNAKVLDASILPWMDEDEDETLDDDALQAERTQRKIMAYFMGGKSARSLSAADASVSAMEEASFYRALEQGEITEDDVELLLLQVRDPLHTVGVGAERMFEEIASDPRKKQILALATGYNARNWQQVNERALRDFLAVPIEEGDADRRTPLGFASVKEHFLRGIKPRASESEYKAYAESMEELEQILYGQRYDFYMQFENLRSKALESARDVDERSVRKPGRSQGAKRVQSQEFDDFDTEVVAEELTEESPVRTTRKSGEIVLIGTERSESILNRVVIEGGAWIENGKERYLNSFNLAEAGLGPAYEVDVAGVQVYLSSIFQLPGGRAAAIGYVPTAKGVKARSYHRNNSEGLWYYLPDYVRGPEGSNKIGWYGEGYGAESLILPIKLQEALSEAERHDGMKLITGENPFFLFAGTAYGYNSRQEYNDRLATGRLKGAYYQEVSTRPSDHDFETIGVHKVAPQMLSISIDKAPDFKERIAQFSTTSILVGKVLANGFESHGGRYNWLFCRDAKNRAWIGNVEATAPVTSTGLRREWVLAGDFSTPLYEYSRQSDGYGDPRDTKGPYQCMWKNYLSKVPMIKKFLQVSL